MAENSERLVGYSRLRIEFENSIQDVVAERLKSQSEKPTRKNMLAFKKRAQRIFPTFREGGLLVIGTEWHRVQHEAAKLTYARVARRNKGK